jgi:hypothetical protein
MQFFASVLLAKIPNVSENFGMMPNSMGIEKFFARTIFDCIGRQMARAARFGCRRIFRRCRVGLDLIRMISNAKRAASALGASGSSLLCYSVFISASSAKSAVSFQSGLNAFISTQIA